MFKKLLILSILFIFSVFHFAQAQDETESVAKVRSGTFLKVLNLTEISSLMADIEDEVVFLNLNDMYVYETNVIPANTKIYGEVEDVLEPVEGRDGAIKISIYKMITPDKKVYRAKGHIYTENDNYIGGRPTQAVYYRRVAHYNHGLKPMLKVAPLNVFEMGKHTVILPGAELFLILEEDVIAKWTIKFFTRYKK